MDIDRIDIDAIDVGSRLRSVNTDRVKTLAESIKAIGLQTPISVWANDDGTQVRLVAGAHRLAAAKQLGWEDIECVLVNMDEIERRRWEIAENLHRAELTALERDQHITEWERLTLEAEKVRIVSAPGGKQPKEKGTRKTARALNIDDKAVRNARKVAGLTDEAKEIAREVNLDDNRSALLRAAAQPPERQADELRRIAERKAVERSQEREIDRLRAEVSWPEDDEPSSEQLDAIRSLDDAELCAFLLKVEGLGLIAALRSVPLAA